MTAVARHAIRRAVERQAGKWINNVRMERMHRGRAWHVPASKSAFGCEGRAVNGLGVSVIIPFTHRGGIKRAARITVNELVKASGMKQANVSKQLAILHDHQLVKREREGTFIRYEIADPMVFSLCQLVCGKMAKDAICAVAVFHPEI